MWDETEKRFQSKLLMNLSYSRLIFNFIEISWSLLRHRLRRRLPQRSLRRRHGSG